MIGYVTVGTNDLARAATFYDGLLQEIGGTATHSRSLLRTSSPPHISWARIVSTSVSV